MRDFDFAAFIITSFAVVLELRTPPYRTEVVPMQVLVLSDCYLHLDQAYAFHVKLLQPLEKRSIAEEK